MSNLASFRLNANFNFVIDGYEDTTGGSKCVFTATSVGKCVFTATSGGKCVFTATSVGKCVFTATSVGKCVFTATSGGKWPKRSVRLYQGAK